MKTFGRSILLVGAIVLGANGLIAAQASNTWFEQWYRAKYGRSSPMMEAALKAERANTAFREETTPNLAAPANTWFEGWYKAKYGRTSPIEEARVKAERVNTAFREETTPNLGSPANTWFADWYKAKYGRTPPLSNTAGR